MCCMLARTLGDPTLQEAASYLSDWSRRNHMKFNIIKSKEIIFVQSSINVAMYDSTPSRIISGRPPAKNPVRWSPELQEAVKRSKDAHFIWKREGRGSSGSCMPKRLPRRKSARLKEDRRQLRDITSLENLILQLTKMKANAEPRLLSSLVRIDSGVVVSQHRLKFVFMK